MINPYGHPLPDDELDADTLDPEQYEALIEYEASLRVGIPVNLDAAAVTARTANIKALVRQTITVKHPGHGDEKVHGRRAGGRLLRDIRANGGFTYRPASMHSPKDGYALSIFQDREFTKPFADLSAKDISSYLARNADILSANKDAYVGGWHDTESGKVYLDISLVLKSKKRAIALARQHNQEGIYDLKRGQTIITKAERDRRKSLYAGPSEHLTAQPYDAGYRELLGRTEWLDGLTRKHGDEHNELSHGN